MNIVIANRQRARKVNLRLLKKITGRLLTELRVEDPKLGINLVAVPEMAALNETFLRHAGSTDVITFDYAENGTAGSTKRKYLHGEIFICIDEAIRQAKAFKTTWQSEIVRYVVHGILHLLGHDDLQPAARRKMKREENRLLRKLSGRFRLRGLEAPLPKVRVSKHEVRRLENRCSCHQAYWTNAR